MDLGAGWTPLRRASRLGDALGLSDLWIKNDTVNPTGSFKDGVVSVALSVARVFGFDTVACASTGNLAGATAAAAAAAGMRCYVFVPRDLETAKIVSAAAYGATVVAVDGSYDQSNRLCSEIAEAYPWAFVNVNLRPYYAEGSKTLAFETAEQLGWTLPDHVVVPNRIWCSPHQDPTGLRGARRSRPCAALPCPRLRGSGHRLLACVAGVP